MTITTANEGRQAQNNGKSFSFTEQTLRAVYDMLDYFGVYGADNDETVLSWATKLIVENYNWPGSLPIMEVMSRFKRAAFSGLYGQEAKTPERLNIMFRKWIDEGARRQELFEAINGKPKQTIRQDGERIEQWHDEDIERIYGIIKMIGRSYDIVPQQATQITRIQAEYERRFL